MMGRGFGNRGGFESDPRDYALEMVEEGLISADHLALCLLKYMSHDDVRGALDANELSPRFDDDESAECPGYDDDEDCDIDPLDPCEACREAGDLADARRSRY
jgi:hypothetical protein